RRGVRHGHGGGGVGRPRSRPGARERDGERRGEGDVARRAGERGPLPPGAGRQSAAAAHHARAALRARSRARARAAHRSGPAEPQGGRGLISGVALVSKPGGPGGPTSHDVVDTVRRALGTDRVGHLGEAVGLPARRVEVAELTLVRFAPPDLAFRARVSGGTYLRSLARDVGAALGCGAHLAALTRTEVGPYRLAEAVAPAAVTQH